MQTDWIRGLFVHISHLRNFKQIDRFIVKKYRVWSRW